MCQTTDSIELTGSADQRIPVIDITTLRDNSDALTIARKLHFASQSLGFIYIDGHGIPPSVIDSARTHAMRFFSATESVKSTVLISDRHRGWLRQGASRMRDDVPVDLKESYVWGEQHPDVAVDDDHPMRGANRWPEFLPGFEEAAMAYYQHAHEVAFHLMRGFALGLNLPEDFFLQTSDRPISRASYVYYPSQADHRADQFGVGPHTDFGMLTVLCQDDVGGLQIQDPDGQWQDAPPIDNTLIVNVGDLLSRWTDGAYKSTPHRVINSSGRERLSLVLAFDPNPETRIDSQDVYGENHSSVNEPITCGEYLQWRFAKAFSYRTTSPADTERGT